MNVNKLLFEFYRARLRPSSAAWAQRAAVSGVGAALSNYQPGRFASAQEATDSIAAAQTGIDNLISWIKTNVQNSLVSAAGWLEVTRIEDDGAVTERTFTSAANAGAINALKTQLQTLLALVSA